MSYLFNTGDRIVFDTHGGDTALNYLSGTPGTVVRRHVQDGSESDSVEEIGPMYWVKLDGQTKQTSAFEDELAPEAEAAR